MSNKHLRELAIALLDDPDGINEKAHNLLADLLVESNNSDVLEKIHSAKGRYFLHEDHDLS